jgi:hypothetical protein
MPVYEETFGGTYASQQKPASKQVGGKQRTTRRHIPEDDTLAERSVFQQCESVNLWGSSSSPTQTLKFAPG